MSDKKIADDLLSLATGKDSRTKIGRLRDLYDVIETCMQAGVNRKTIIDTLASGGLKMTVPVFDNAMSRIRTSRKTNPAASKPVISVVQQSSLEESTGVAGSEPKNGITASAVDAKKNLITAIHAEPDLVALARIAQQARKEKK